MSDTERPDLYVVTEPEGDGGHQILLTTDKVDVDAHGLHVYVVAGQHDGERIDRRQARVVIDRRQVSQVPHLPDARHTQQRIELQHPHDIHRLVEVLTAAAAVLDRIQNGTLP